MSRIQGFDGQHLANAAWGFAHLQAMDPTLLAAISQRLASLDDSDLTSQSCCDLHWALGILQADDRILHSLRNHACPTLDDLVGALRDVGDTVHALVRYQQTAFDHQVLNLREFTKEIMARFEMPRATEAFGLRAKRALEIRYGVLQPWRVFAYLEYAAAPEGSTDPVSEWSGQLLYESGGQGGPQSQLQAIRLPLSGRVKRELCAEFQAFSELTRILSDSAVAPSQLVGVVSLFTTISPCLSCLAALRQFQRRFPDLGLELLELPELQNRSHSTST